MKPHIPGTKQAMPSIILLTSTFSNIFLLNFEKISMEITSCIGHCWGQLAWRGQIEDGDEMMFGLRDAWGGITHGRPVIWLDGLNFVAT